MIKIREAIVVEGRYDKSTLSNLVDAVIIETNGFSVMNDRPKLELLRRLASARGIVIFTDSDSSGFLIRNYLKGALPPESVKHAYIPDVYGRERRKDSASSEGKLGVEGMEPEVIINALKRSGATIDNSEPSRSAGLTKADLFKLGLSGRPDSAKTRALLKERLELPERLSTAALLDVLNSLYGEDELIEIISAITGK